MQLKNSKNKFILLHKQVHGVFMIKLAFLDYKENIDLDILITEYANCILEDIICFALDYIEDSSDIEHFSPTRLFAQSPDECLSCIKELRTFSQDSVLHKDLSPIYQYFLYRILSWYIDVAGEIEDNDLYEMNESLKEHVSECYGISAINRFSDVKNYLCEFFDDWDFLPDFLAGVVQLYIDNSSLFTNLTSIEELENYVELMDGDTLRKYQSICAQRNTENNQEKISISDFDTNLRKALLTIQRDSTYWNLDENRLNDKVCNLLRMVYDISDQSRQGLSLSRTNPGEIDFLIFDNQEPIIIMEALKLDCLNKQYLKNHLTKLLVNYDPIGCRRACLIVYVTAKNFGSFWSDFSNYIGTYQFPYPTEKSFTEVRSQHTESRTAHVVLSRSDMSVIVSFYAIHIPKKEESNE